MCSIRPRVMSGAVSFFVRHCDFSGGNDRYRRLRVALTAEIDADAWAFLCGTEAGRFDKPVSGKIAVKVIRDHGDDVMKGFEV